MGLLLLMGDSGFRGALDSLGTGLESAWSVGRRLRSAYTGPIVRVRRSSDNAEQDFSGSGPLGLVDPAAVAVFCGAGDGFLTTIYDQSGLSRNFTQTTTTLQPLVVSSGAAITKNGRLASEYDGSTSLRRMNALLTSAVFKFLHDGTASTVYSVQEVNDDTLPVKTLFTTVTNNTSVGIRFWFNASEQFSILCRGVSPDTPITITKTGTFSFNVISAFLDADNATAADRESIWQDGSELAGDNLATSAVSTADAQHSMILGGNSSASNPYAGKVCELVIWSQDQRANRAIWEASAKSFWGTP